MQISKAIIQVILLVCHLQFQSVMAGETGPRRLSVFVSIPPQKYLVERIAGETAKVSTLMTASGSPETFEPDPGQIELLLQADVYLPLGIWSEGKWHSLLTAQSRSPHIVSCCRQLMTLMDNGHRDPHIWTDPVLSLQISAIIKSALIKIRPAYKDLYEHNYRLLASELTLLDKYFSQLFSSLSTRGFIVSHPAWGYLAQRYGIRQFELEHEGREIGLRAMAEKIRQARILSINTIFVQKQHYSAAAHRLAEEINADIIVLDPLKEDHINNLRETARLIAESMQ